LKDKWGLVFTPIPPEEMAKFRALAMPVIQERVFAASELGKVAGARAEAVR
jgi:hypothetical protein